MGALLLLPAVFVAAFVIGWLALRRVPPLLHTPLMSMTNAISAVTILGALLLFAAGATVAEGVLGAVALATAAFNLVGGFVVTDRMARLFRTQSGEAQRGP